MTIRMHVRNDEQEGGKDCEVLVVQGGAVSSQKRLKPGESFEVHIHAGSHLEVHERGSSETHLTLHQPSKGG